MAEVCRSLDFSVPTYYKGRKEYVGVQLSRQAAQREIRSTRGERII